MTKKTRPQQPNNAVGDTQWRTPSSSQRKETQLPAPAIPPVIRAQTILSESRNYNWKQQYEALRTKATLQRLTEQQVREELEMLCFQFRMSWQDLWVDVISELRSIPPPEQGAEGVYLEETHQAFYPVMIMELFQQDFTPEMEDGAVSHADPTVFTPGTGRAHWAQLLQFQRKLLPEEENENFDESALVQQSSVHSYDDLSSAGGVTPTPSNTSFGGNGRSPSPSPIAFHPEDSKPKGPTGSEMSRLKSLIAVPPSQCPLDYSTVRYDADTRGEIIQQRQSRKAQVLGAIPTGKLFMSLY